MESITNKSQPMDHNNTNGFTTDFPSIFNIFDTDFLKPCALQKYELIQYIQKFSKELKTSKKEFEKYYIESVKSKQKTDHYPTKIKEISDDNDKMKSVISQYEKKFSFISAENLHYKNLNNDLNKQIHDLKNQEVSLKNHAESEKSNYQLVANENKQLKQEKESLAKSNLLNKKKIEKIEKELEDSKKIIQNLNDQNSKIEEERERSTRHSSETEKKIAHLLEEKNEFGQQRASLEKTILMLKKRNSNKNSTENNAIGSYNKANSLGIQTDFESQKETKTKVNLKKLETPKPRSNQYDSAMKNYFNEKLIDTKSTKINSSLSNEIDNLNCKYEELQKQLAMKNDSINKLNVFVKSLELKVVYLTKENIELKQRRENAKAEIKELYKRSPSANSAQPSRTSRKDSTDQNQNENQIVGLRNGLEKLYKEYVVNTFTNDCKGMNKQEKIISIKIEKKLNNLLSDLRDINEDILKGFSKSQSQCNLASRKSTEKITLIQPEFTKSASIKKENSNLSSLTQINLMNQRLQKETSTEKSSLIHQSNNRNHKEIHDLNSSQNSNKE